MKNILKNFLMIGLIIGLSSCDETDIDDPELWLGETEYVNETGYNDVDIIVYKTKGAETAADVKEMRISFNGGSYSISSDTHDLLGNPDNLHWISDSIKVTFGKSKSVMYYFANTNFADRTTPDLFNRGTYQYEEISHTHRKYTYTFTKDLVE